MPMLPRIFFEIKNNFIQTKAFISNLISKKETHPLLFRAVFDERLKIFIQYWKDLFYENNLIISLMIFSLILYFYFFHKKSLTASAKRVFVYFLLFIISLLFIFSLFYQGNFFYGYYFQGFQYFFLMILIISVYGMVRNKKTVFFAYLLTLIFISINIFALIKDVSNQKDIPLLGLRADDQIVRYIYEKNSKRSFCLRIYTPPVIPYTYDYLLSYYSRVNHYQKPSGSNPVDNKCWYIVDKDDNNERVEKWRKDNIPANAEVLEKKIIDNGTLI